MKVIGTAGHIDHGKSTLVQRLTGIDPDRLGEEKRRGMTIDLGFAWLTLPSGREASIVDVPGHERFIKNMLAGAAGIDVALLVVAADEGVMPQTREHLDILDLLGVSAGVVAITKIDLVDDEWLDLIRAEVDELLAPTSLARSAIVPVSARSGKGLVELLAALDAAIPADERARVAELPFLPVDRVFTVAGFGTVVTGTLHGGDLAAGQEVEILPAARRARIRGIQTHRRAAERAEPGTRAALNLAPLGQADVARGSAVVLPGTIRAVRRFAARVRVLPHLSGGLSHGLNVAVHAGAAEVYGKVSVLDGGMVDAGDSGWVQIALERPVPTVRGQHFVLRLPAPLGTVAGGEVVDVRPRRRRTGASEIARLERLAGDDACESLRALLDDFRPYDVSTLARVLGLPPARVRALLSDLVAAGGAVSLGGSFVGTTFWGSIAERAEQALRSFHASDPLARGMAREELRRRLGVGREAGAAAIARLCKDGLVTADGPLVMLPGNVGGTAGRFDEVERLLDALREDPFAPPSGSELLERARTDRALADAVAADGLIVRVAEGLYFDRGVYDRLVCEVVAAIEINGEITVAELRDRYATSRKYALALLEHLDDERITRRLGDKRVLGSRRPACA
jgi:selenocysteine-specific elongation factor